MKTKFSKNFHRILIGLGLLTLVILWLNNLTPFDISDSNPVEIELTGFEKYALLISIAGEMIPSVAKQFISFGATGIKLLMQGFSPIIFGLILATGQLAGQMLLYVLGMFVKHVHRGSIGDLASKNHYFHEHHFLIYLAVPFASVLGDAVMIYSGHQRINPLKIMPFLFISNLADNYKWIFTSVAQLEVADVVA